MIEILETVEVEGQEMGIAAQCRLTDEYVEYMRILMPTNACTDHVECWREFGVKFFFSLN